jgi:hypothetical protein
MKLAVIYAVLFLSSTGFSQDISSQISEFIAKIIREWNEIDAGVHDVAFLENSGRDLINLAIKDIAFNVIGRIQNENPVTFFDSEATFQASRKFSFVIAGISVKKNLFVLYYIWC